MKLFFLWMSGLVQRLPIIMVPWRRGGVPVIRNASLAGLKFVGVVLVILVMVIICLFMRFYQAHPLAGKVLLCVVALWCFLRFIGICRSLFDDPYTRIKKD
ncbi:MAG: hypothetical protein IJ311_02210 [Elusimicrobiaceae bacterium]|nr:hypothetical protein [Elusimicrobiaceae bacterium]